MLELKNISKRFGEKQIISDLNLKVPEKQILAIVGPSGGGKTTLLRMLAGLETIDSGDIIYNGEELPLDELEKRNLLGFVFQDFQLFPHLTVLENLTLSPIKTKNVAKEDAEKNQTTDRKNITFYLHILLLFRLNFKNRICDIFRKLQIMGHYNLRHS